MGHVERLRRDSPATRFFDVGAGVGDLSEHLRKTLGLSVTSIEHDPYAAAIIRTKQLEVLEINLESMTAAPEKLSEGPCVFFILDVLEHLKDPKSVLQKLSMNPSEEYALVTVPALEFLYSYWDRELGHFRRYDKPSFRELVGGTPWEIVSMEYFFSFAVLPAYIFRSLLAPLRPKRRVIIPRASKIESAVWTFLYRIEKILHRLHLGPRFGTSLMVVLKKKGRSA
jgi:SAM-dependent methyltransferase